MGLIIDPSLQAALGINQNPRRFTGMAGEQNHPFQRSPRTLKRRNSFWIGPRCLAFIPCSTACTSFSKIPAWRVCCDDGPAQDEGLIGLSDLSSVKSGYRCNPASLKECGCSCDFPRKESTGVGRMNPTCRMRFQQRFSLEPLSMTLARILEVSRLAQRGLQATRAGL